MKNPEETVGIIIGRGNANTRAICCSLAKEGITAVVRQKEAPVPDAHEAPRHWSGQPGKDLFFNGWKLLF